MTTARSRPAAMARMAAALLIVDRDDAPGRALLALTTAQLEDDGHGRRGVPGSPDRPGDGWIGTVALAIAARQAGHDALADELADGVVSRLYLAPRLGVEGVFWALAAGIYGALGVDGPTSVSIAFDGGTAREVRLEDGVAEVPIDGSASIEVHADEPVWVRTEARYVRPWSERQDAPLRLAIEGVPGAQGERAALELVVENTSENEVGAPIVEVTLPGGAVLDRGLQDSDAIRSMSEPDGAGTVRISMVALDAHHTHRIALPIRWIAFGRTIGLALSGYDASSPWVVSQTQARTFDITAARGEGEAR